MLASMDRSQQTNADLRSQVDALRKHQKPHRNAGAPQPSRVTMLYWIRPCIGGQSCARCGAHRDGSGLGKETGMCHCNPETDQGTVAAGHNAQPACQRCRSEVSTRSGGSQVPSGSPQARLSRGRRSSGAAPAARRRRPTRMPSSCCPCSSTCRTCSSSAPGRRTKRTPSRTPFSRSCRCGQRQPGRCSNPTSQKLVHCQGRLQRPKWGQVRISLRPLRPDSACF